MTQKIEKITVLFSVIKKRRQLLLFDIKHIIYYLF